MGFDLMKKLLVSVGWLFLTPLTLILSIFALTQVTVGKSNLSPFLAKPNYQRYSALPGNIGSISQSVVSADGRIATVENFLHSYNSPMSPYAQFLVETADKYGLDFRLLPAIAMQESGGGHKIPSGSYNAWGFGVYGRQSLGFASWENAIDTVARYLKKEYIDKGLVSPEAIMTKYTPPSVEKGGPWAKGVSYFLEEMQ